jgi:hypothetical protein
MSHNQVQGGQFSADLEGDADELGKVRVSAGAMSVANLVKADDGISLTAHDLYQGV